MTGSSLVHNAQYPAMALLLQVQATRVSWSSDSQGLHPMPLALRAQQCHEFLRTRVQNTEWNILQMSAVFGHITTINCITLLVIKSRAFSLFDFHIWSQLHRARVNSRKGIVVYDIMSWGSDRQRNVTHIQPHKLVPKEMKEENGHKQVFEPRSWEARETGKNWTRRTLQTAKKDGSPLNTLSFWRINCFADCTLIIVLRKGLIVVTNARK